MQYDPNRHHRRSIRLKGYDYRQAGLYFVTICTLNRKPLLGEIIEGAVRLSPIGEIVATSWVWLGEHYPYVELDEWVMMPNHLHGILAIHDVADGMGRGGSRTAPTTPPLPREAIKRKSLGRLIGAFKTVSTKHINQVVHEPRERFWQRDYYETIIRDEDHLNRARQYIQLNPANWSHDNENPNRADP
jgi:putative transposase